MMRSRMLSSGRLRVLSNGRVSSIRCVQIDRLQYNRLHFGVGSNTQCSSGLQIEMFHARGGSPVRSQSIHCPEYWSRWCKDEERCQEWRGHFLWWCIGVQKYIWRWSYLHALFWLCWMFVCSFFQVGRSAMYCRDKDETQILAFHKTPTSQVLRRDGRLNSKAPSPIRRLQPPMGYSASVVLQMPE